MNRQQIYRAYIQQVHYRNPLCCYSSTQDAAARLRPVDELHVYSWIYTYRQTKRVIAYKITTKNRDPIF